MRPYHKAPVLPLALAVALFGALAAAAAFSAASVAVRAAEWNGHPAADVLVNSSAVMQLRTSASGYSSVRRAEIVAGRLREVTAAAPQTPTMRVSPVAHGQGLYVDQRLIVTVYKAEATAHGLSVQALAKTWRDNLARAWDQGAVKVSEPPPGAAAQPSTPEAPAPTAAAAAPPEDPSKYDWTGTAQKWVPIISVEQGGLSIGAAQIAGPTTQVGKVKAVAQIRLDFKNIARIYAYIPTASLNVTTLERVQGVSVWATGDIRLIKF